MGGSHGGVAKWDLRTQGGQVSQVLITGLNADTVSSSHRGGRNRLALDSVHPPPQSVPLDQAVSGRGAPGPGPPRSCWTPSAGPSSHTYGPWPAYGPRLLAWPPSTFRSAAVVPGTSSPWEAGLIAEGDVP